MDDALQEVDDLVARFTLYGRDHQVRSRTIRKVVVILGAASPGSSDATG